MIGVGVALETAPRQLEQSQDASEYIFYNDEEKVFLAKENLALFCD